MTRPWDLEIAHNHSIYHQAEVLGSDECGCFYCLRIFATTEITEWIDEGTTAMCPYCGIDALLGSASGFPLTAEFLRTMHDVWFGDMPTAGLIMRPRVERTEID